MSEGWVRHRQGDFLLDVAWKVAQGEVLVLYGPSGAGKTTTLRAIAGLVRPREGHIVVGEQVVLDSGRGQWVPAHRRGIGYVPQEHGLFPHLSVRDNIAFGLIGWAREERNQRVAELVAAFQLHGLEEREPRHLSSGQRQRVALARALAPRPRLLLLDEPFAALDAELRRHLRRELRHHLAEWDIPVILVTHDREEALALGSRVAVIEEGRVITEGEPVQVLGRPPLLRLARAAGVENLYEGVVEEVHAEEGVMTCRVHGIRFVLALGEVAPGQQVRFGMRANEVLVAVEEPRGLSAQNILPGHVTRLEPDALGVRVEADCGLPVVALVTPLAVDRLGLTVGRPVWIVVKSSSLLLLNS